MHDHFGKHAKKEVLDQANGEAEAGPIVAVLHDLQAVAIEVDITVKVHLVEGLHGDLVFAMVLGLVLGLLEGEVVLDRLARVAGLFVLARADGRDDEPETGQQRNSGQEGKEDGRLETTSNLPRQPVGRNAQDES